MKKIVFISLFFVAANTIFAQHSELGVNAGAAFYKGDLSHTLPGTIKEAHPAFGLFVRSNPSDYISYKLMFNYASVAGRDKHAIEDDLLKRDLSFRSSILELGLQLEYNIMGYQPYALSSPFSPYVFVGVSGFKFRTQTRYQNDWVDLRPLKTEGVAYKNLSIAIPFGVGVKYALNDHWNVGAEFGMRPTLTDYLDDVSKTYLSKAELTANGGQIAADLGNKIDAPNGLKRGNNSGVDWYHILNISISYNFLDNGLVGVRGRLRKRSGCRQSIF
jgi:opacity protein-like surface antigen